MLVEQRVDRSARPMRLARIAFCAAAALTIAPALFAQIRPAPTPPHPDSARTNSVAPKGSRRILGVFDASSSAPIDGADVVDLFVDEVYRTGPSGLVGLWALHARHDTAAVRVRKLGYADTAFAVLVGVGDTVPVSIFLHRLATLPSVVTDAPASKPLTLNQLEFESRRNDKSLTGRFLGREDLEKRSSIPIGEVIYDLTAGKSRGCNGPLLLFVDGIRALMTADDMRSFHADEYQGIEFYTPDAAPLRFGGTRDATPSATGVTSAPRTAGTVAGAAGPTGSPSSIRASSSCGVVALWRRESP